MELQVCTHPVLNIPCSTASTITVCWLCLQDCTSSPVSINRCVLLHLVTGGVDITLLPALHANVSAAFTAPVRFRILLSNLLSKPVVCPSCSCRDVAMQWVLLVLWHSILTLRALKRYQPWLMTSLWLQGLLKAAAPWPKGPFSASALLATAAPGPDETLQWNRSHWPVKPYMMVVTAIILAPLAGYVP